MAWAAAVALLTGTLFLVTLRPDVGGTEDSPKFQFLGQVLGTAHTPGYPFYTIATYLFTRVPIGTLAWRVNLFSAVCGVLSCLCVFLIARRLGVGRPLAFVAALAAATGFPVWSNSVTAEVYTLSALMSAATVLLLIMWAPASADAAAGRRYGLLFAACAVFAAGLGNHLTIVGLLPAALIYGIVKDRSVLRPRVIGMAAIIGVLGVAQYGFIALRTLQGAPYLEARATTLRGVYDVIIARDVSWARFYQAADKVVGIEVPMLLEGLRVHMGTVAVAFVVIGIVVAVRRRNWEALLVAGGAAGTLGMIANLWGDVVGFITPVVVLLWTLAAYGFEATLRAIRPRDGFVAAAAVGALSLPVTNVLTIYPKIQPLLQPGDGPSLRAMYGRLPANSAVVAHNYFIARILNYLDFSNEYDPDPSPRFLVNDAPAVKAAAADGLQVFALQGAVEWLRSQGLIFELTPLSRQPFPGWLAEQPGGTLVIAATAGRMLPYEWLPSSAREHAARRANFGAFAWTLGEGDPAIDLRDDRVSFKHRAPDGREFDITADDAGVQVVLGDDVISAIDRGLAVVAVRPNGRLLGHWEFGVDEPPQVQLPPAAYVLRGEGPCAVLRTSQPVDVTEILSDGGWYATVDGRGTAEIQLETSAPAADWRDRLANGRGSSAIDIERGRVVLDGAPGTRAVFHLSVPPTSRARADVGRRGPVGADVRPPVGMAAVGADFSPPVAVRKAPATIATLLSSDHAVRVCQAQAPQLPETGTLAVGPDADERFSVGWHLAEDAGTQVFRWARRQSTLLWRTDRASRVRFILRVRPASDRGATITAAVNGAVAGSCTLPAGVWTDCRIDVPATVVKNDLNALVLTSDTIAAGRPGDPRELAFVMQRSRVRTR